MRKMQEKITAEIVRRIENVVYRGVGDIPVRPPQAMDGPTTASDLEAVIRERYANTGRIFAQRGFVTEFWVDYDFQDLSCHLKFGGEIVQAVIAGGNIEDEPPKWRMTDLSHVELFSLEYDEAKRLQEMFDLVTRFTHVAQEAPTPA